MTNDENEIGNRKKEKQKTKRKRKMELRQNLLLHETESDQQNASENNPTNYAKDRDKNTEE